MSRPKIHNQNILLRVKRVRARINGTAEVPRLALNRALKGVSAQLIDDVNHRTLCAVSERDLSTEQRKVAKTALAAFAGALLAKRAKEKKIVRVVFDRRGNKYHGRVEAFAQAAREGGLEF